MDASAESSIKAEPQFGKAMLHKHFPHVAAAGDLMLNSGSFGMAPKCVIDRKIEMIREFESYGEPFVRQRLMRYNSDSIQAVTGLLSLEATQCALVDNVTVGIATLLDCFAGPSDTILTNSWTYGAVRMTAETCTGVAELGSAGSGSAVRRPVINMDIKLPVSSTEAFVDSVREAFDRHPEIRVAIFDHITSATACTMPVHQLTELAHSRGALVIIDGAHAIGQVANLDIPAIGADFYVGNLHKWCFSAKSAALLWARSDMVDRVRPSVMSWLSRDASLALRFAWYGTSDTSSVHAVTEAVRFVREDCGGLANIHAYCNHLADTASRHLTAVWKSHLLPVPKDMQAPFMRMVALPEHLQCEEIAQMTKETRLASRMWEFLLNRLKIDTMILTVEARLYVRICCSVIVNMDDIRRLGEAMLSLTKEDFLAG